MRTLNDSYSPASDFVALAANGDVPLTGSDQAQRNLDLLTGFTRDDDRSNRDWATMALGMYGPDTAEVRAALILAADDQDSDVRGEAIEALARRDIDLALPLVVRELSRSHCGFGVFVAAGLIADPALVEPLEAVDTCYDPPWLVDDLRAAIEACKAATPIEHWRH